MDSRATDALAAGTAPPYNSRPAGSGGSTYPSPVAAIAVIQEQIRYQLSCPIANLEP